MKKDGSKFAACMWICTKEALTGGQILDREREEYLKKRIAQIGSVLGLSLITNGCHQERKTFSAWHSISKSMSRAWHTGAYCGFQHLRIWTEFWDVI